MTNLNKNEVRGAHVLVRTLLSNGIDTCFANPGTSEMHFVAALDTIPGMKCVLGLQENVVTGMADGYYRIAQRPACTLLHCGPGLANGLANLHNARRAASGILNIVGDHATYHRAFDAPLTADTDALARTVSGWVKTCDDANQIGQDAASAAQIAKARPGQVATLILPSDVSWNPGGPTGADLPAAVTPLPAPSDVEKVAQALGKRGRTLMLLSGAALSESAQDCLRALVEDREIDVMAEYSIAKIARGYSRLAIPRMPYSIEQATAVLARYERLVLVNAVDPVSFFAYPEKPSRLTPPGVEIIVLTRPYHDALGGLQMLLDRMGLNPRRATGGSRHPRPEPQSGRVTPEGLASTIAALMPENSIISDESISFGRGFYQQTFTAPPHDWLHLTGGAIGDGIPVATGAAIASGMQRRVINIQADGSAMYSIQALWTQAREKLPCTTILLNNRKYQILLGEYAGVGATPGATALSMLDLGTPPIDFTGLAQSLGVEAARATTLDQCADLLRTSFGQAGPFLIELMIE